MTGQTDLARGEDDSPGTGSGSEITDLTRPIYEGMEVAEFYTPTMMWHNEAHDERSRFREMTWASLSLVFSEHGLTHVESMRHLSPTGPSIDQLPVSRFVAPAVCLDVDPSNDGRLSRQAFEDAAGQARRDIRGAIVLARTQTADLGRQIWIEPEAAGWLVESGVAGVGVECRSVDPPASDAAHAALLGHGAVILENLANLAELGAGAATLVFLPLKIRDGTAAPARVLAIDGELADLGRRVLVDAAGMVDLSQPIYAGMPGWKGIDVSTRVWPTPSPRPSQTVLMGDHAGTHVDALYHYSPEGAPIDQAPLEHFLTPAACLDMSSVDPDALLDAGDLQSAAESAGIDLRSTPTVLLWTGHNDRTYGTEQYMAGPYTGLDREAMEWLSDQGVWGVGIDSPSTDISTTTSAPSHRVAMERDMYIMEHLANLGAVAGQRFTYWGIPLPIRGGSASPIRAVGIVDRPGAGAQDTSQWQNDTFA